MKVIYVAGPFRARNANGTNSAWGTQQHVMRAMELALEIWKRGHAAICPHANTMFFQDSAGCADDVWLYGDLELLRRCDAVLMVPGWEKSQGATAEKEVAESRGIPVLLSMEALERFLVRDQAY